MANDFLPTKHPAGQIAFVDSWGAAVGSWPESAENIRNEPQWNGCRISLTIFTQNISSSVFCGLMDWYWIIVANMLLFSSQHMITLATKCSFWALEVHGENTIKSVIDSICHWLPLSLIYCSSSKWMSGLSLCCLALPKLSRTLQVVCSKRRREVLQKARTKNFLSKYGSSETFHYTLNGLLTWIHSMGHFLSNQLQERGTLWINRGASPMNTQPAVSTIRHEYPRAARQQNCS